MIFKKKYIVVFLIKEQESYTILKSKRITPTNNSIKYGKNKSIPIEISLPTYSKGLKLFYFVDMSSKVPSQITFSNLEFDGINSEVLDMIMNGHIIRELSSNLSDNTNFKMNLLNIIIGGLIGGLIGFVISPYIPLPLP